MSRFYSIRRSNFPLYLAWALSIHKLQGSTKTEAVIDIGSDVFEAGMSYVALSRVTTLSGVALVEFDPSKVYANPRVLKENARLRNIANERIKKSHIKPK